MAYLNMQLFKYTEYTFAGIIITQKTIVQKTIAPIAIARILIAQNIIARNFIDPRN